MIGNGWVDQGGDGGGVFIVPHNWNFIPDI